MQEKRNSNTKSTKSGQSSYLMSFHRRIFVTKVGVKFHENFSGAVPSWKISEFAPFFGVQNGGGCFVIPALSSVLPRCVFLGEWEEPSICGLKTKQKHRRKLPECVKGVSNTDTKTPKTTAFFGGERILFLEVVLY
jgi:hypothetical protein